MIPPSSNPPPSTGDFVIVDPIEEGEKVKGEISAILYKDHIQHLKTQGVWPQEFSVDSAAGEKMNQEKISSGGLGGGGEEEEGDEEGTSEEDDSDLFVNTNRANYHYSESEGETDSEEEEEENSVDGKD
ncbi:EIF1A protein, partial [Amia calva]|nr:EIF1A protein [Amia calva]